MTDKRKAVKFTVNKTDLDGNELDNAVITIYDKDGKEVDSWTSKKGETHDFGPKLKPGEEYTLKEVSAPEGYETISEIKFKVNDDYTVEITSKKTDGEYTYDEKTGTLVITDKKIDTKKEPKKPTIKFEVNKTDVSGNELDNAVIEIRDENNKLIDSWTSKKGETHDFGPKLEVNKKYTLIEKTAPNGYQTISNIEFKVKPDGTIEILSSNTNGDFEWDEKTGKMVIKDKRLNEQTSKTPDSTSDQSDKISRSSNTTTTTNNTTTTSSAHTGQQTHMAAWTAAAGASLGALWILLRKKKESDKE